MKVVRRILVMASMACMVAVSSAGAGSEERGGGGDAQQFIVTSTLDGKKVLPHRIRWRAYPKLPSAQIARVVFLIDGKVRWIERSPAPYTYGFDSNWLVTTWLSPGSHRFTVRAVDTVRAKTKGGRTAERTTIARVLPAPTPPASLANTRWTRTLQLGPTTPAGKWDLSINKVGWKIRDPGGHHSLIDVVYLSGGRLQARGGIYTRLENSHEGNGWCLHTNARVDYRWAVSADTLTLTLAGPDRCGKGKDGQHFVWAGPWTKVG
ncbi:MAG: hypothetical protein H0U03_02990 [Actinobacteria bacterium]|nr:hypothetical protein [Actinomycetota bacterium]